MKDYFNVYEFQTISATNPKQIMSAITLIVGLSWRNINLFVHCVQARQLRNDPNLIFVQQHIFG